MSQDCENDPQLAWFWFVAAVYSASPIAKAFGESRRKFFLRIIGEKCRMRISQLIDLRFDSIDDLGMPVAEAGHSRATAAVTRVLSAFGFAGAHSISAPPDTEHVPAAGTGAETLCIFGET